MKTSKAIPTAPILIIRWIHGKREKDEIADVRKALGRDRAIRSVRPTCKEEFYQHVTSWLKTPNAQVLCIGAHGSIRGLTDRKTKPPELMKWEQLGSHLASVREALKRPVALILGACYSSLAPPIWTTLRLKVPVSFVFCIAEEPFDEDVVALIVAIMETFRRQGPLSFLDEDVRSLLETLPPRLKLRLFLRGNRGNKYAFVEINPLDDQSNLQQNLDVRVNRRKVNQFASAVEKGLTSPVPSNSDLRSLRRAAKRHNRLAIDDEDCVLPTRPIPKPSAKDQISGKPPMATK